MPYKSLVIWHKPVTTTYYFLLELGHLVKKHSAHLTQSRYKLVCFLSLVLSLTIVLTSRGQWSPSIVVSIRHELIWCLYWIGLGILSSVGLGTGLHTFLLYLGPHIARVTVSAYECGSLDFPKPPYPARIICPVHNKSLLTSSFRHTPAIPVSLLSVMGKVRLEAFMWGVGTAIGELPPYFMARFARLSERKNIKHSVSEDTVDEPVKTSSTNDGNKQWSCSSFFSRAEVFIRDLIYKVGFWGILICASIPNPLFDIAGLTCGHFLIPFWTFFGATLIGKAVIKMHLQVFLVIVTFSKNHLHQMVDFVGKIPLMGQKLKIPFQEFLEKQRNQLHSGNNSQTLQQKQSWLQWSFEWLVFLMVLYFLLSIVNSLAQSHQRRKRRSVKEGFIC